VNQVVFRSLSSQKELKLSKTLFKSNSSLAFLPDVKLQLSKFEHAQKAKIRATLPFRFLSSPLLSLFFPRFFSFFGHLLGFLSVGKGFAKSPRIVKFF